MGLPDRKWAKRLYDYTSEGLILLHLFLMLYYAVYSVLLMLLVNLACLLLCGIGLYLLRKERILAHTLLIYLVELIHLTVSAIWVGWSAGIQVPLIGLTAMVFLSEYLGRSMKLPYIRSLPLALVNFGVYLTAFPFFFHRPGLLGLERSAVITAEMLWSLLVFGLLIWGMFSVVQLTSVSEHRLANKAETDELTGLLNRAGYDRLLEELDLNSTTLLLVDTDKFKGINDTFGHETGDRVLQKISRSLIGNFRQNDYVCRIGGDEFAILMVNVGTLENEKIAEKIRYINRELAGSIDDELPAVSVSVGVAHGAGAESWSELFRHADAVLYRVKQNGGRGCMVHNTESA